jgi:hypothetical protein
MWIVPGTGEARFDAADAHEIVVPSGFPGDNEQNTYCSFWTAADLDADGTDEIVSVDRLGRCSNEDPTAPSRLFLGRITDLDTITTTVDELPGGMVAPRAIQLVDLDVDGRLDLVVLFGGDVVGFGISVAKAGLAVYWGVFGGFDTAAPTIVSALPVDVRPTGVAALNADGDKLLELAVATDAGIFVVDHAAGTPRSFVATDLPVVTVPGRGLVAGDVDADGLDDLVFCDDEASEVYVYTANANKGTKGGGP